MKSQKSPRPFLPATALICRLALAIIFLYAGIEKVIYPGDFAVAIYNYRLLPDYAINFVAVFLPWLEITIALSLIIGINVRVAALLSSILFMTFATVCCFGSSSGNINWSYLIHDLFLFCISIFILILVFDRGWRYFLT
ncbi:putative methylamine utilization protein maue [hydrocarbon metagenome]|uniref:Putative methylamine utilization protein maue n=1 Tax=hydrocarbon metagenome TaxID=938273 RepID=A0A0W8FW20_9ZZZZ